MKDAVADSQQKTTLVRSMCVQDELSFDNGRVVIRFDEWHGRKAVLLVRMDPEVKVDKPPRKPPAGT